jgi:hypothetical protein
MYETVGHRRWGPFLQGCSKVAGETLERRAGSPVPGRQAAPGAHNIPETGLRVSVETWCWALQNPYPFLRVTLRFCLVWSRI